eukprot:TRINITY_DN9994_c0_g4_i1.p1 TRINITY_DN9994_c0_g4~~TRINITY_DN9994_c0_g4_i1.p1  ORF type:complete len:131 (+),score=22.86 TRINITY_DN9994_c0_g4_i1:69-461(+)
MAATRSLSPSGRLSASGAEECHLLTELLATAARLDGRIAAVQQNERALQDAAAGLLRTAAVDTRHRHAAAAVGPPLAPHSPPPPPPPPPAPLPIPPAAPPPPATDQHMWKVGSDLAEIMARRGGSGGHYC